MKLTLPSNGNKVNLDLIYGKEESFRTTTIIYEPDTNEEVRAIAICNKGDQFQKLYGKHYALSRLLAKLRNKGMPKIDRKAIAEKIFQK